MTTERNAQGVDGLAEVMGLLGKATPGEWSQDTGGAITRNDGTALFEHAEFNGIELDERFANTDAATAAVNYLRSHGEAIREVVEAQRALDATRRELAETDPATEDSDTMDAMYAHRTRCLLRRDAACAALAKFPEPRP